MAEDPDDKWIDEDPLTPREIDDHLRQFMPRKDIRQFLWVLRQGKLIAFHE